MLILADDLGYGDLGCYGSPVIRTPCLDRFAGQGVRMTDCYAASPNCSPARAAVLTGRTPYRVGMYDFLRTNVPMHLPTSETTVAEILREAGYQTMFCGKWHLSGRFNHPSQPQPGDHGFDYWLANRGNFDANPKSLVRNGSPAGPLEGIACEVVVRETIDWLKNRRDPEKPFCIFVWLNESHTPVRASDAFAAKYADCDEAAARVPYGGPGVVRKADPAQRPVYFGCVSQMDHEFGRLMDALVELELGDETLVYFTSDNGPEHRAKTSWGSPGKFRGAKGHMHEGGIRVPGIMRWPGKIPPGSVCREPINGTDVLPTLCAAAGCDLPEGKTLDGVNVLPAVCEGKTLRREKPLFWWLYHARGGKQVCIRDGAWKMLARMTPQRSPSIADAKPPAGMSIMEFIKKADLEDFELHNLSADPSESTDAAGASPERFESMRKQMTELFREIQAEGPVWESVTGSRQARSR